MSLSVLLMVAQAVLSPAGAERDQMLKDHEVLMACCPIHQLQAGRVFSVLQGQQPLVQKRASVHWSRRPQRAGRGTDWSPRGPRPAEAQNHLEQR
jgi:hypothetical protein